MGQFHFEPDSYLEYVRLEVPAYDELEETVAGAAGAVHAERILDLGAGTGETARRVLERQPAARIVLLDSSAEMLALAREIVPGERLERVLVQRLEDPLPAGPFDLVVSALAIHHLESEDKQALFRRIAEVLRPVGRIVLADLVVPDDPERAPTPVSSPFDRPDRLDDQLTWIGVTGLEPSVIWSRDDLVVISADRPNAEKGGTSDAR
jgi:tRNA (cmo5U34)-methyltransferase